jgi:hypothetical protein
VARLRPSHAAQDTRRAELRRELVQLEGQITNLTDAVALGAPDEPIPALLGAIKDRERRCDRIRDELVQLEQLDQVAELDAAVLQLDLEKLLAEWPSWIGGRSHQARQILQKLVVGRLVFTTKTEDGTVFYEFSGVAPSARSWPACCPPV